MSQYPFGSGPPVDNNAINPNDLMSNTFGSPYYPTQNEFGTAALDDDELLEGLTATASAHAVSGPADFSNMNMAFSHPNQPLFSNMDHISNFGGTPNGQVSAALHNRYAQSLNTNPHHGSFSLSTNEQAMMAARGLNMSPQTRLIDATHGLNLNSQHMNVGSYPTGTQPVRMEQSLSNPGLMRPSNNTNGSTPTGPTAPGSWMQQPTANINPGSFGQSYKSAGGNMPSPNPPQHNSINSFLSHSVSAATTTSPSLKNSNNAGATTTGPVTASSGPPSTSTTIEAKRRRRRESHNLVERRRRDNINERIQDLSRIVPAHRLEDDKIRKLISNGTPLSPNAFAATLAASGGGGGASGPGARRNGNIATGLPIDDKDKGPNKGDILNGAVAWMRDLLWLNQQLMQQREELENTILEMGGTVPFDLSEDERRMHSEISDVLARAGNGFRENLRYSRTSGSGLRVPRFTDYKGEPLATNGDGAAASGASEGQSNNEISQGTFEDSIMWNDPEADELKEEEERYMAF